MALEDLTGTKYLDDLNASNPAAGDNVSEGDDHIRGIKNVLKVTLPNVTGAVTPTHTELNYVDGVTSAIQTQLNAVTANDWVTTARINADAITGAEIADDAIDSEHYAAGSIDTAHIADNQVTLAKMAGLVRGKIIYGNSSGDPAALTVGSANQALISDGTDVSWGTTPIATVATTVTITDNEATDENNAIIFGAGGDVDGGNLGLESDGNLTYNPSTGTLNTTNISVTGTQTIVNSVTMNASNAVIFEGATADAHETTLTTIDATGDRTISLPNVSGTIPVLAAASATAITSTPAELNLIDGGTARGTTALATGDGILINDGGTMAMTNVDTVRTYMEADSMPKSGGTFTGNVTHSSGFLDMAGGAVYLADNAKALFGTGEDLHIYHENTNHHSYIWEKGSGDLYLRGTDVRIKSNTDNDDMATFIENGAATLFYSNGAKLATTNTGIDVTGTGTFTTADNLDTLTLTSTDADAAVGPNLVLWRNSANPADNDLIGTISFDYEDSGGNQTTAVNMHAKVVDVTDTTEDGWFELDVMTNGTANSYINCYPGEFSINDDGIDLDFRVESDNSTHALFVQGSDGNVGIGQSPSATSVYIVGLQIGEQANLSGHIDGTGAGSATYLSNNIVHNSGYKYINADLGSLYSQASGIHSFDRFVSGSAGASATAINQMKIDASGNVGIGGVASPAKLLTVEGSGIVTRFGTSSAYYEMDGTNGLLNYTGTLLRIQQTGMDAIAIDTSGNVGIGETSALAKLHIKAQDVGSITLNTEGDDFLIEGTNAGMSIISADAGDSSIVWGSPSDETGVLAKWNHNANIFYFRTSKSSAKFVLGGGDSVNTMTLDGANVGIGVTPEAWQSTRPAIQIGTKSAISSYNTDGRTLVTTNDYVTSSGTHTYIADGYAMGYEQYSGSHRFQVGSSGTAGNGITWVNALHIDPNARIHTTTNGLVASATNAGFSFYNDQFYTATTGTGTNYQVRLYNGNGLVGSITTSGSATAFNTSSDYRLKENVDYDWDATTRLKQLKPARFNFIVDDTNIVDGFLAHEVSSIVPEAISGTKDAMMDEEYEVTPAYGEVFTPAIEEVTTERQVTETVETGSYVNLAGETITETQEVGVTEEVTKTVVERQEIDGVTTEVEIQKVTQEPVMETVVTTEAVAEVILETDVEKPESGTWRETTAQVMAEREVPDMQGIDQGKLVPLLVKTIQELEARITALEA